jgi:hypothetical protein
MFSGELNSQMTQCAGIQKVGVGSSFSISQNQLSGPLPSSMYNLKTDAHSIGGITGDGTNFRCEGDTGDWPSWVYRISGYRGSDGLGKCKPVPTVASAVNATYGGLMRVIGTNFLPTPELKCKMTTASTEPVSYEVAALYRSPTTVECVMPLFNYTVPPGEYFVTVANYGSDFYDTTTHPTTYVSAPSTFLNNLPPLYYYVDNDLTPGALAAIIIGCSIPALLCLIFLLVLIMRECSGKPMFSADKPPA